MRVLDLDVDYFMDEVVSSISENSQERLSEEYYAKLVWNQDRVVSFLEDRLGLSRDNRVKGKIVRGHNEALLFWKQLITDGKLSIPFEVIHVDSHADLGLGYASWKFILDDLIKKPVSSRTEHNGYIFMNKTHYEGVGDYLLFAIAYRWVSHLVYCANPNGDANDYVLDTLKNFHEEYSCGKPVRNVIQLAYNENMERPKFDDSIAIKKEYFRTAIKEPEVPFDIIPTIDDVKFEGNYDYIVVAQSPNYTPASADYVLSLMREYIDEV